MIDSFLFNEKAGVSPTPLFVAGEGVLSAPAKTKCEKAFILFSQECRLSTTPSLIRHFKIDPLTRLRLAYIHGVFYATATVEPEKGLDEPKGIWFRPVLAAHSSTLGWDFLADPIECMTRVDLPGNAPGVEERAELGDPPDALVVKIRRDAMIGPGAVAKGDVKFMRAKLEYGGRLDKYPRRGAFIASYSTQTNSFYLAGRPAPFGAAPAGMNPLDMMLIFTTGFINLKFDWVPEQLFGDVFAVGEVAGLLRMYAREVKYGVAGDWEELTAVTIPPGTVTDDFTRIVKTFAASEVDQRTVYTLVRTPGYEHDDILSIILTVRPVNGRDTFTASLALSPRSVVVDPGDPPVEDPVVQTYMFEYANGRTELAFGLFVETVTRTESATIKAENGVTGTFTEQFSPGSPYYTTSGRTTTLETSFTWAALRSTGPPDLSGYQRKCWQYSLPPPAAFVWTPAIPGIPQVDGALSVGTIVLGEQTYKTATFIVLTEAAPPDPPNDILLWTILTGHFAEAFYLYTSADWIATAQISGPNGINASVTRDLLDSSEDTLNAAYTNSWGANDRVEQYFGDQYTELRGVTVVETGSAGATALYTPFRDYSNASFVWSPTSIQMFLTTHPGQSHLLATNPPTVPPAAGGGSNPLHVDVFWSLRANPLDYNAGGYTLVYTKSMGDGPSGPEPDDPPFTPVDETVSGTGGALPIAIQSWGNDPFTNLPSGGRPAPSAGDGYAVIALDQLNSTYIVQLETLVAAGAEEGAFCRIYVGNDLGIYPIDKLINEWVESWKLEPGVERPRSDFNDEFYITVYPYALLSTYGETALPI